MNTNLSENSDEDLSSSSTSSSKSEGYQDDKNYDKNYDIIDAIAGNYSEIQNNVIDVRSAQRL